MNLGFALSLVSEWELAGVTDAVISPGSRSGPMAVALGQSERIATHVVLDERSAGFHALGLSKVSGMPTVILTTSGTATANLRPSVTEAFHSGVPMIILTADRPLEAHKFGAAQTMEQEELFSDVVLFRSSPSVPDAGNRAHWRALGSRAFHESVSNPLARGPVHLNLAFREPLIEEDPEISPPRAGQATWYRTHLDGAEGLFEDLGRARRVLMIAGESDRSLGEDEIAKCVELGWPVVAGPSSGFRYASGCSLGSFEAFLRSDRIRGHIWPEIVVLLGNDLASRTVSSFIAHSAKAGSRIIRVSPGWNWRDPLNVVSDFYFGTVHSFLTSLPEGSAPSEYLKGLMAIDSAANEGIRENLGTDLSDPVVSSEVYGAAGSGDMVFASSSMPIRDLEWFAPLSEKLPTVYSNRGVNGIDGVTSSFHGAATAHQRRNPGSRSFLLIGDLAFRHDIGALADISSSGLNIFICVTDNSGGGIFSFLPRSASLEKDKFERLFAAPQNGDLAAIGSGFGLYTQVVKDVVFLRRELEEFSRKGGVRLVIARSDRSENVAVHQKALEAGKCRAEEALDRTGL